MPHFGVSCQPATRVSIGIGDGFLFHLLTNDHYVPPPVGLLSTTLAALHLCIGVWFVLVLRFFSLSFVINDNWHVLR
jgi:hypothetical protein